MGTANLIKMTSAHNVSSIVKYNTKASKTIGQWRNQPNQLTQTDLVSFSGEYQHPNLSLHQQGVLFVKQAKDNAILANMYKNPKHRITSLRIPRNYSLCHTVVQSFDYKANPNLQPKQVHKMGIQMLIGMKSYFRNKYNYTLNGGLVSTHIDDDHEQLIRGKVHHTHLHNHIIILSYNNQGKSISPYIRKIDMYSFQHINDNVGILNNLRDYYFLKLKKEIQPNSSYTKSRPIRSKSHLQQAVNVFSKVNNKAFDHFPRDFKHAKQFQKHQLVLTYQYQTRKKPDTKTHKTYTQFTMKGFVNKNKQIMWFNLMNLRILQWKNKKEERCERMIKQLNISQVQNIPITYNEFQQDLIKDIQHIPPISQLSNQQARQQHSIMVSIPQSQQKESKALNASPSVANYLNNMNQTQKWSQIRQTGKNDYQLNHVYNILQKNNNKYISPFNTDTNNTEKSIQNNKKRNRERHQGIQR